MQITSEAIQRWIRIALYYVFGGVGALGIQLGGSTKEIIISIVGFAVTAAWTKYGSSVNAMLTEVEKTDGIAKVNVQVDPNKIDPKAINEATPDGVTARPVT